MIAARFCLLALLLLLASGSVATSPPRIAIIIDDLGYQLDAGRRAIDLPGPISFAVLPGTPRARALALQAHESGKEVLLHLPLQAEPNDKIHDPLGLNLDMSRREFGDTFRVFIDSYTTHESIALQIAKETGIDARKRDVFLDPDRDPETVVREFERMKRLAQKRGSIVVIGHPYAATLDLLERELPNLADEGYELVTISKLMQAEQGASR
jgi:polysaccharide deacetylase 2 family uncharacterized protein YibQ